MAKYLDCSGYQYKAIPETKIKPGDVFICQTVDIFDPFQDWDFAVGRKKNSAQVEVLGKFKKVEMAMLFADAV